MHDFLLALSPTLPTTFTAWFHLTALALAGSVKVFRGSIMQQRARRIDLFGWSIILFDYIFGVALLIGTLWAFYPRLQTEWFDLIVTGALVSVTVWQGLNVWSAPDHRINRAMTQNVPVNENGIPITGDRRQYVRREADRKELVQE